MNEPRLDPSAALSETERLLAAGDPQSAREWLIALDLAGVPDGLIRRYVDVLIHANRMQSRQPESLAWIERQLREPHEPDARAALQRARIECLRSLDTRRALDLADEALADAEAAGDEHAYATVLSHAAFAAYRRGEVREAARYAALASARSYRDPAAAIAALRARMFAATAAGQLEQSLDLSIEIREQALAAGDISMAANECNNIAEAQLKLGRPLSAIEAATRAGELAARTGFVAAELHSRVLIGVGMAENGDLDTGISVLRRIDVARAPNPVIATDTLAALCFWLVERDGPGDSLAGLELAEQAAQRARTVGLGHSMTPILCSQARAQMRVGDPSGARAALEEARTMFDIGDSVAERHLAIAMGDILAAGDPARRTALSTARAHLLRDAGRRDDPLAYCTGVRVHRRLLEMTGGVPLDLPQAR